MTTKLVIYRNNSLFEKYLAPILATLEGYEVQVFPVNSSEDDIFDWIHTNFHEKISKSEVVYMDDTSYGAAGGYLNWQTWPRETQLLDSMFRRAAGQFLVKSDDQSSIREIVARLMAKERPKRVVVVSSNIGDHKMFGEYDKETAEKLRAILAEVTGLEVWVDYSLESALMPAGFLRVAGRTKLEGPTWAFVDRHYDVSKRLLEKEDRLRLFKVPVENLVQSAMDFGVEFDADAFAKAIRNQVASW